MVGDPASFLPHGLSFRFVDRVLELVPGERVVALKNVTANDPHLQDHFPGHPLMPGVLLVESMAQTAGLLLPEGSSREARLFCRLLPSEVAEIEAAAKMVKKSKSDWIREVLLAAARRRPKVR